ncbi:MAG: UMP kinase [Planctomycetota bacterium]
MYKRIVLKIGGESLCSEGKKGIDLNEIDFLCKEIKTVKELGIEIAVVIGGGNIIRGRELSSNNIISPATADYMGMLATLINAIALQDALEKCGIETRVQTALTVASVAEPFIRRKCISHLSKGRIVILAAGTGNPYVTTDTAAALRAAEIKADVILKATKVDGVYTDDPNINRQAKKLDTISYLDIVNNRLKVMDSTAITMCMENKIPVVVFSLKPSGNLLKVIKGEKIGTYIV